MSDNHIAGAQSHSREQGYRNATNEQVGNNQTVANTPQEITTKPSQCQGENEYRNYPTQEDNPSGKRVSCSVGARQAQNPLRQEQHSLRSCHVEREMCQTRAWNHTPGGEF